MSEPHPTPRPTFLRGLSFAAAVALVVGNMVGTSVYLLPATLAKSVGPLGLVAWILTAVGYGFVALAYARLAARTGRSGGPYVYVREAFGDFAAFQTVWSYWISVVLGNAAIALAVVGYVAQLAPGRLADSWSQFLLAQGLLLGLTAINVIGVRFSGRLQIAIVLFNVIPLVVVSLCAARAFDAGNLVPFAPRGWSALPLGMAIVVWAFSGIESATVPAEEIVERRGAISRATLAGYFVATCVFLASALAVAGAVDNETLAASERPLALAMERAVGPWAADVLGVTAVIAGVGTLNGWILMAGRIPVSAAEDGLFFRAFARLHPRWRTPHVALLVAGGLSSVLLFKLFSERLLQVFDFVLLLSVLTTLVPHLFAMAAQFTFARREERVGAAWIAAIAFAFVLLTIGGCGALNILWGLLVLAAGVPLYARLRR